MGNKETAKAVVGGDVGTAILAKLSALETRMGELEKRASGKAVAVPAASPKSPVGEADAALTPFKETYRHSEKYIAGGNSEYGMRLKSSLTVKGTVNGKAVVVAIGQSKFGNDNPPAGGGIAAAKRAWLSLREQGATDVRFEG